MDTNVRQLTDSGEESASRMMEEEPPEPTAQSGWVVDSVNIRQAKNGGWIVSFAKHEHPPPKNGSGYETSDYTFASLAEAVPFIEQEFGASAETGGVALNVPALPSGGMR